MTDWMKTEPPVGEEIEYQRDNGAVEKGSLKTAGEFGMGPAGRAPRMRQQYRRDGQLEMFEIVKWRRL